MCKGEERQISTVDLVAVEKDLQIVATAAPALQGRVTAADKAAIALTRMAAVAVGVQVPLVAMDHPLLEAMEAQVLRQVLLAQALHTLAAAAVAWAL